MNNAYSANVKMNEARWTDKDGSTVTFKLPMTHDAIDKRNPFNEYTKRRKGKAGTRFMMACVDTQTKQMVYQDEVMLTGWNDSQSNGHTVKFWLATDAMGHPFEGFDRATSEFYISLIELEDDNTMIDPEVRARVERAKKRPSDRPSYAAAMICKNEGFHTYCQEIDPLGWSEAGGHDNPEEAARQFMCDTLGINSRAELDRSEELRERYHSEIWNPFRIWQGEY